MAYPSSGGFNIDLMRYTKIPESDVGSNWFLSTRELDPCWDELHYSPRVRDRKPYLPLLNYMDSYTGGPIIDQVDYTSGHDVLPLQIRRVYKIGLDGWKYKAKWFFGYDYKIDTQDGWLSALDLKTPMGCSSEGYHELDYSLGFATRPLYLFHGIDTTYELFGALNNRNEKKIIWFNLARYGGELQVPLERLDGNTWQYYNRDNETIERYKYGGSDIKDDYKRIFMITSITDAKTNIKLTWEYGKDYTKITRTGGAFLKLYKDNNGDRIIETANGNKFRYHSYEENGYKYLDVYYPGSNEPNFSYTYDEEERLIEADDGTDAKISWKKGLHIKHGDEGEIYASYSVPLKNSKPTIVKIKNAKSRLFTYTINSLTGRLETVAASDGGLPESKKTYTYVPIDKLGNHIYESKTVEDSLGNKTHTESNYRDLVVKKILAYETDLARTTTTSWHELWNIPNSIDTDTTKKTYHYYSKNRPLLTSKTIADKRTGAERNYSYSYSFYNNGLIKRIAIDGPRTDINDISYKNYDTEGRLISSVDEVGHETDYLEYDAEGRLVRLSRPDGSIEINTYDDKGQVVQKTIKNERGTLTSQYSYDKWGRLLSQTSPEGIVTHIEYTKAGRTANTHIGDQYTFYAYDSMGQKIKEEKAIRKNGNNTQTFVSTKIRDSEGRITKDKDSRGYGLSYSYDTESRVVKKTNALNIDVADIQYNALNQVTSQLDGMKRKTLSQYDQDGNLILLTDNINREFRYSYDAFRKRLESVTPPTGKISYDYDNSGNVISTKYEDGSYIYNEYDPLDRIIHRTSSDGNTINFYYDRSSNSIGKLGKVVDATGYTEFAYDDANRNISSMTSSIDGHTYSLSYTYNKDGDISSITYPSGYKNFYEEDNVSGKIVRIKDSAGNIVIDKVGYYPFGPLQSYSTLNNRNISITRDKDYRITILTTPSYKTTLTYNELGYIYSKVVSNDPTRSSRFSYNANGELTKEIINPSKNGDYSESSYRYDGIGNRIYRSVTSTGTGIIKPIPKTGVASAKNDGGIIIIDDPNDCAHPFFDTKKISSVVITDPCDGRQLEEINYTYDKKGLLSTINDLDVKHDTRGNVTSISGITRHYNALNQQISSNRKNHTTHYFYNGLGFRVLKKTDSHSYTYIYGIDGLLLAEYTDSNLTTEYIYLGKQIVAVRHNNALYFVYSDHTGRPEYAMNTSGAVTWSAKNSAFGRRSESSTSGLRLNIGYPGQYYDREVGSWYNKDRDYDPSTGRYLQSDPMQLVDGPNTYVYARNNPITNIDPTGNYIEGSVLLRPQGMSISDHNRTMLPYGIAFAKGAATGAAMAITDGLAATLFEGAALRVGMLIEKEVSIARKIERLSDTKVVKSVDKLNPKLTHENPRNLIPTQTKSEISGSQVKRLTKDMKQNGFDQSKPVDAWRNPNTGRLEIQDGHHRTEAAKKAGLDKIPVQVWEE